MCAQCLCNIEQLSLPPYSRASVPTAQPNHHRSCAYLPAGSVRFEGAHPGFASTSRPADALTAALAGPPSPEYIAHSASAASEQFERIVAGQESEIGEAPPSYDAIT